MSTPNNGNSFEEQLREKLAGHEYEYHPAQWAKMQHKLNAHLHAASAAKTAVLKKTLYSAGKITGAIISGGAIVYTILSLGGMVDRTDLGFGEKPQNQVAIHEQVSSRQLPSATYTPDNNSESSLNAELRDMRTQPDSYAGNAAGYVMQEERDFGQEGHPESVTGSTSDYLSSEPRVIEPKAKAPLTDRKNEDELSNDQNLPSKYGALASNSAEEIIKEEAEKKDSASEAPVNPLDQGNGKYPDKDENVPFKPQFGITGGASLASMLRNSANASTPATFNLNMIGAFIAVPVNSRIAIQTGIQFRNQHNWDFHKTTSQVYYSMVQDSTATEYAITSGQYIDIPLIAKLNLTSKIQVHAGAKLNWLQSTRGTLSEVYSQNGEYKSHNSREIYSKPEGFRTMDLNGTAGAEYRLTKLLSLGAAYHYGLQDLRSGNINVSSPIRNSYIQVYAAMRLF